MVRNTGLRPCSPASRERAMVPQRPRFLEKKQHVVKLVLGFQVQQQRRVTVLLHDGRRAERTLQAVGASMAHDPTKRPQRFPSLFPVVRKLAKIFLHLLGRAAAVDNRPLRRRKSFPARRRRRRIVMGDSKTLGKHGLILHLE